jgi:uncharacterized membrane protein YqjE
MKLLPLTRHTRRALAGIALAVAALALMATAVLVEVVEAYRLGLAMSLVAAFSLALLHNMKQAHANSRHKHRKNP